MNTEVLCHYVCRTRFTETIHKHTRTWSSLKRTLYILKIFRLQIWSDKWRNVAVDSETSLEAKHSYIIKVLRGFFNVKSAYLVKNSNESWRVNIKLQRSNPFLIIHPNKLCTFCKQGPVCFHNNMVLRHNMVSLENKWIHDSTPSHNSEVLQ